MTTPFPDAHTCSTGPEVVLASASPRRRQLLSLLGLVYRTAASDVPETPASGEAPGALVRRLALAKAWAHANANGAPSALIIGADTVVVAPDGSQILGKPNSEAEALRMLQTLSGRRHSVFTGVALLDTQQRRQRVLAAHTPVSMRDLTAQEIAAYVASGDPMDKAGAYGIQHPGFSPIEKVGGCYANVMGLPLCHLYAVLSAWDVRPRAHPLSCCPYALEHMGCVWAASILAP